MAENQNAKQYDLEPRTLEFSRRTISFCRAMPKTYVDSEIGKQLVRSATSVGANYIEANESLGKKDFLMRIRICRKEAKECGYWLNLIEAGNASTKDCRQELLKESIELMKIFGAILNKSQS
ncbi:MAG TPA: four helix bundle protein [Dehalococcoidia bacterium]|nr:four helix bundle protein [Dehalococcoidia bacterium]